MQADASDCRYSLLQHTVEQELGHHRLRIRSSCAPGWPASGPGPRRTPGSLAPARELSASDARVSEGCGCCILAMSGHERLLSRRDCARITLPVWLHGHLTKPSPPAGWRSPLQQSSRLVPASIRRTQTHLGGCVAHTFCVTNARRGRAARPSGTTSDCVRVGESKFIAPMRSPQAREQLDRNGQMVAPNGLPPLDFSPE